MYARALALMLFAALLTFAASLPAQALEPVAPVTVAPGPLVGDPAPAFDLPTVEGKRVSLQSLRGKTVVVNVWATWCPPCRQETADLVATYKQRSGGDVAFVGIDSTEEGPIIKAFVASKGVPYTQAVDRDKTFAAAYAVRYFPTTFVIDPQGVLRTTFIDVLSRAQLLAFIDAAKVGRNGEIVSTLQDAIDKTLDPARFTFTGDAAQALTTVGSIRAAIAKASDLADESDSAHGKAVDLIKTQRAQQALRQTAIDALAPLAATDQQKAMLSTLRGDRAAYVGDDAGALAAYTAATTLDPKDADAFVGLARAAKRLHDSDAALAADEALVHLSPSDIDALVTYGVDAGSAGRFAAGRPAFERAVELAQSAADKPGAPPKAIRKLAYVHMYYGRMEAKAKDRDRARTQFAAMTATTLRLPKNDIRYEMYLEQAQEATVALDLGQIRTATSVSLAPWTGVDLPGSIPDTVKYRLIVAGLPGKTVALQASGVPSGWVASFCTDRVCAPLRTTVNLPTEGVKIVEFQLVPPTPKAAAHAPTVTVTANDGRARASARTVAMSAR